MNHGKLINLKSDLGVDILGGASARDAYRALVGMKQMLSHQDEVERLNDDLNESQILRAISMLNEKCIPAGVMIVLA